MGHFDLWNDEGIMRPFERTGESGGTEEKCGGREEEDVASSLHSSFSSSFFLACFKSATSLFALLSAKIPSIASAHAGASAYSGNWKESCSSSASL